MPENPGAEQPACEAHAAVAPAGQKLRTGPGWLDILRMKRQLARHRTPRDFEALRGAATAESLGIEITSSRRGPWVQIGLPFGFVWKKLRLPIAGLPPALHGLRILHLSDLHLRAYWGRPYDQLIARVQADVPDLILMTGDFIEDKANPHPALPFVRRMFPALRSRLGLYGIQGNHDPDSLMPHLPELGIHVITHRRVELRDGDTRLELIGLTGSTPSELDYAFLRRLPPRVEGVPRIVMCHYPDLFASAQALEPDLYLSGHTHGGQVCLPNGWPIISHDWMPKRFAKGIHRIGRTWYVVSQGMGFSGPPVRLFCPAEVVEITLI
jgi:hypothetical protein